MHTDQAADAIAAATHRDPYPFYARLRAGAPLQFDPALRLWIAARAEVVRAALAHPALRVRPPAEPVPRAIVGTPAGELFGHLVRMNDGPLHAAHRPVLQRGLAGLDLAQARAMAREVATGISPEPLDDWCLAMPASTVAALLGFEAAQLPALARWTRDFVACLSPLSNADQLKGASAAALELLDRFEALVAASPRPGSLLAAVQEQAAAQAGVLQRTLLCNLVGLLSQTCEATAALLGNAIVALRREPGLHAALLRGDAAARDIVAEVARHDAPVQNTRRFVADGEGAELAGVRLAPGDAVLVLLASAMRDPALHDEPDRFELARAQRHQLGFGHGPHACPGMGLAQCIAAAGLEQLCSGPLAAEGRLPAQWRYRPSVNGRLPLFDC